MVQVFHSLYFQQDYIQNVKVQKKKISVINTSLWAVINKKVITRNALCQPQVWIVLGKKKKESMAIVHS